MLWLWLAGLLFLVACELLHLFGPLETALKVQPWLLPLALILVLAPVARKEFFTEGSSFYLVMEYVEGQTLRQLLNANGPLDHQRVIPIIQQVCQALAYLHSQKPQPIVFRDLKPGNLMVSADGTVKLIDFGICRFVGTPEPETLPLQLEPDDLRAVFSFAARRMDHPTLAA